MPHSRNKNRALGVLLAILPALTACSLGSGSGSAACRAQAVTVAAAPSIAPAVEQAARRYDTGSSCARVTVARQEPSDVAGVLPDESTAYAAMFRGGDPPTAVVLSEQAVWQHDRADPMRPVAIVPIAFGPDVDAAPLQRVAAATGGQAFVTLDPRQIRQVFLEMLIRLTCGRSCPTS